MKMKSSKADNTNSWPNRFETNKIQIFHLFLKIVYLNKTNIHLKDETIKTQFLIYNNSQCVAFLII